MRNQEFPTLLPPDPEGQGGVGGNVLTFQRLNVRTPLDHHDAGGAAGEIAEDFEFGWE